MTYLELAKLRDQLLKDVRTSTRMSDFSSEEDYRNYLNTYEEGVIHFYCQSLLHLLNADSEIELNKTA